MTLDDVLSGGAGIAGVRRLVSGHESRRAVHRALDGMLADGTAVSACHLHRVKFKPGRKLSAWYTIEIGGVDHTPRHVAVTWHAADAPVQPTDAGAIAQLVEEAGARRLLGPFRRLSAWVPSRRMRVLVAPLDVRYPTLMRLSDPGYAAGLVPGSDGARHTVATVRYRPGERHVLRYEPAEPPRRNGRMAVYVKLYAGDAAEDVWRRTAEIADWLDARPEPVAAARPVAHLREQRALLYQAVAGSPLGLAPASLRGAGAALRLLHSAPTETVAVAGAGNLDREIAAVARAAEHFDPLLPDVARMARRVLHDARLAAVRLPEEPATLVHGDFKLDHVWRDRDRFCLIDLDRCRVADPALDVGKFLADLRWRYVLSGRSGVRGAQRSFLGGYSYDMAEPRLDRARLYEAVLLVKAAARRAPLHDPRWEALSRDVVATAERLISAGVPPPRLRRAAMVAG